MAKVTMATREELITRQRAKYIKASKNEKGQILDNICLSTGLSRSRAKHIMRSINKPTPKVGNCGRKPTYNETILTALEKIWYYMDFASGRRLVAGMACMLEALERHGEIKFSNEITSKLKKMSAATADRLLKHARIGLRIKGKSTTKPGTLLKKDIPLRLGTDWDDAIPGYVEIDLVAHCGETAAGDYINTLDVTDICTGWTETQSVLNKAQRHVFAALINIGERQPFPYLGIDSDNGSEFINDHLYRYCNANKICFTRSRPNRKNDNCYVEQKNWHVVRRNIGYGRYEGQEAVNVMNKYYVSLRLYMNFFLPQAKLISKIRYGARIRKKYDTPKTPYQRLLESEHIKSDTKSGLEKTYVLLNPAELKREMAYLLEVLETHRIRR